jgi:hypothetical protein
MSNDVHIISIALGDPGADDVQLFAFEAPAVGDGGGVTVVAAHVVDSAATSGTVGWAVALHTYSNAATPLLNGTIAAAVGGTTDHWAADVPKDFSVTDTYVSAGEQVVLQYDETNAGNPTNAIVNIHYKMGK